MAAKKKRTIISGTERNALPKSQIVGDVDPNEQITVTVLIRSRPLNAVLGNQKMSADETIKMSEQLPEQRQYLNRESFVAERGADSADIAKVEAFALEHHLTVTEINAAARSVKLSGTIENLTAAFNPNLKNAQIENRVFRTRSGTLSVPNELKDVIVGVFGFDNRPVAVPHCRFLKEEIFATDSKAVKSKAASNKKVVAKKKVTAHNASDSSFKPPEVAKLYNFPAGLDGAGQCIAIIELNDQDNQGKITGTGFSAKDLKAYFSSLGLAAPIVTAVGVDGGKNLPGPSQEADGEVMLDIEVAGAVAPKANIAVYFAPNTNQGFLDAINTAVHDNVRKPSVISISWGGSEDSWTTQAKNAFNQIFQDAAALGVTICCSSGDDGSSDIRNPQQRDGHPHVDFPASSPFALACGGTKLLGAGAIITSEVVWNEDGGASGGGVSNFFARPAYQTKAKVPKSPQGKTGRGVPDVAGNADPATGFEVRLVGGQSAVIGGTSAVSPLWAGLIALLNQRLTTLGKPAAGFLNPVVYNLPQQTGVFREISDGNNDLEGLGKYKARAGWDACTGLGTPNGANLLTALGG